MLSHGIQRIHVLSRKDIVDQYSSYLTLYRRFLDDIFVIWDGPKDVFLEFLDALNSKTDRIKLSYCISDTVVAFLFSFCSFIHGVVPCRQKPIFSGILGLQPRDKMAINKIFSHTIYMKIEFPEERNAFVLNHQHGRREVTCKPAIRREEKTPPEYQRKDTSATILVTLVGTVLIFSASSMSIFASCHYRSK